MCNLSRKWLTLRLLGEIHAEEFFEVGFGTGEIMISLGRRGLRGRGIDLSADAVRACQQRIIDEGLGDRLEVGQGDVLSLPEHRSYDLVIAFEVIEHIEDDLAALHALRRLLRPQGHLLLSVPAHRSKWGATDVWAGHVRRYERAELEEKLGASRFAVRQLLSCGYPLLNLTRPARNFAYARVLRRGESRQARTEDSGVKPPSPVRRLRLLVPAFSWLVHQLQRPFLHSDLGEGYFALAQRED